MVHDQEKPEQHQEVEATAAGWCDVVIPSSLTAARVIFVDHGEFRNGGPAA